VTRISYFSLSLICTIVVIVFIRLLPSYGITFDEIENMGVGHKTLNFYLTGHLNYADDLPILPDHPYIYTDILKLPAVHPWPFPNVISAISCQVFHNLGWLSVIDAHHLANLPFILLLILSFFWFVSKYFGRLEAILAILILLTTPRLFADYFDNIKDIPLVFLFSLTLFLCFDWLKTKQVKSLSLGIFCLALTAATKPDVIYIPPILLLFILVSRRQIHPAFSISLLKSILPAITISLLVLWLLFPLFLPLGFPTPTDYIIQVKTQASHILRYVFWIGTAPTEGWNLYLPLYILVTTPILTLFLYASGIFQSLFRPRSVTTFLLSWIGVIAFRHTLPGAQHYDGVRHFMVIFTPLTLLASSAVVTLCRRRPTRILIFSLILLAAQIHALVVSHPFQNTYFNQIIGGLGGAQSQNWRYSHDYWLSSYRHAINWLNKHTTGDAAVSASIRPDLLVFYDLRPGLSIPETTPSTIYVISTYKPVSGTLIHQESRQGGIVYSLYSLSE